jgi:hypothetical protein
MRDSAFFDPELLAKSVMTPEQDDTVRRGCCPKCMTRTLSEPTEGGGVAFRQCSGCGTLYAGPATAGVAGRDPQTFPPSTPDGADR